MPTIPRDPALGSSLALIRDPYRLVSKQCRRYGADLFETRLLLRRTVCMTGPAAAELFYDTSRFSRQGAMPAPIRKTLLGEGSVQGLDGEAHRHRKRMLMSLMGPERIAELAGAVAAEWRSSGRDWAARRQIVLDDELPGLLTRAVCAWAGVPLAGQETARRARQLRTLFDGAGATGPRHLWSRLSRKNAGRWIAGIVGDIRAGRLHPPDGSAAHVVAWHRQLDGALLSPRGGGGAAERAPPDCRRRGLHHVHRSRAPSPSGGAPQARRRRARLRPSLRAGSFIPQGGGDYGADHRCAGEWITIELMKVAADMLGRQMRYDVPDQDLRIDFARLPALPRSRSVIRNVSFVE